jgi:hypothetical protein
MFGGGCYANIFRRTIEMRRQRQQQIEPSQYGTLTGKIN